MAVLTDIFPSLTRTWVLSRTLRSNHPSQPSGTCSGVATFTPLLTNRQDSDNNGKTRVEDLLYAESGTFEMKIGPSGTETLKAPFEKKYIWRLECSEAGEEQLSIHFVKQKLQTSREHKPGQEAGHNTQQEEEIDYLFHTLSLDIDDRTMHGLVQYIIRARGNHLCVRDNYQSNYSFVVAHDGRYPPAVLSWKMRHTVTGPKKDQIIETTFSRECDALDHVLTSS